MQTAINPPNKTKLNILALSVITAMTSQSVFAIDNTYQSTEQSTRLIGDMSTQSIDDSNEDSDLPVTRLDTIEVVASPLDASEQTDEYVYYSPSTATGLTLTPKQTPQSVTTITSQQINDQDLETLEDVIMNTPGISEANLDGGKSGSSARGFAIDQYSIDGQKVGYSTTWVIGEDRTSTIIYDRAEIVRGASGLTTGSGRPSASINLVRKRADSTEPTATFSIDANEHETYGASFDGSTPITEDGNVRARFVAEYKDGDTYIDRESKERTVLYGVVNADITDNTTMGAGVSYQEGDLNSAMWGALPAYFSDGSKADFDVSKNASVDWVNWHSENLTYFGSLNHDISNDWSIEVKGSRTENEGESKLFYLLGNAIDKQTGLGLAEYNGHYDIERNIDNAQASINGTFDALGQRHELRFGASYYKNEEKGYSYPASPNFRPIGNFFEWDGSHPEPTWGDKTEVANTTTKENSLFASGRFQLSDPMALILGTRVTDFDLTGDSFSVKDIDISHDEVWVPYVGATYDVNSNHTLFASYTSIFEPQLEKNVNNEYLDPIEGNNYEVGIKSSNDLETLQAQFSVFRIEQDKLAQQDGQNTIIGITPPTQAYYEAEGATSTGIDVEITGELSPNWKTSIGYTQFNAEDADGKTINSTFPDRLFKLLTTYDASNWVSGLTLGAGVNWSDERYSILENPATGTDEKYDMDEVALVNLMARYKVNDNLDLQLNVDNLFDEKYIESLNFSQIYYGAPLTVSGKLTFTF